MAKAVRQLAVAEDHIIKGAASLAAPCFIPILCAFTEW